MWFVESALNWSSLRTATQGRDKLLKEISWNIHSLYVFYAYGLSGRLQYNFIVTFFKKYIYILKSIG